MTPLAFQNKAQGLTFLLSITFYTNYPPQKKFPAETGKTINILSPLWLTSFCLHFILHHLIELSLDNISKCYLFYTGFRVVMITAQTLSKVYNIWD